MLIYSNGTFDGWFYVVATGEIRAPDLWSKSDWLHGMVMKQINTKIAYIRCFFDTHNTAMTINHTYHNANKTNRFLAELARIHHSTDNLLPE